MANAAPVFLLKVDAAAFVEGELTIYFDAGVLTSVTIDKPSEAETVVEIPLSVVLGIVPLPDQPVVIRVTKGEGSRDLTRMQTALLEGYRAELEKRARATISK